MSKLQGKVALVTGASKGIGAGIARELASAGAAVGVNYATNQSGAEAVVREITAAGPWLSAATCRSRPTWRECSQRPPARSGRSTSL